MWKLVLGIIAVVCVQFVFVHFMVLQTPLELTIAPVQEEPQPVSAVIPEANENSDPAPVIQQQDLTVSRVPPKTTPPIRFRAAAIIEPKRPERRVANREPARQFAPEVLRPIARGDFRTVVISYNRNANWDCPPREVRQSKPRSYVARNLLKKPWNLIKSIGSKFN